MRCVYRWDERFTSYWISGSVEGGNEASFDHSCGINSDFPGLGWKLTIDSCRFPCGLMSISWGKQPPFWARIAEAQWNIEESMSHLPKVRMTWEMMIAAPQIDYADCKTMGKFKALLAGLHSVYQAGKQLRDWTCKKAEQTSSLPVACYSSLPLQSASAISTYDGIMCPTRQSFFTW